MTEPRCERTDLPVSMCAHCRPSPVCGGVAPDERGPVFTAEYHGTCAICDDHISPGDEIARLREGGYACEECLT